MYAKRIVINGQYLKSAFNAQLERMRNEKRKNEQKIKELEEKAQKQLNDYEFVLYIPGEKKDSFTYKK